MCFKKGFLQKSFLSFALFSCFSYSFSSSSYGSTDTLGVRKTSFYLGFTPESSHSSVVHDSAFNKGYNVQLPALIQGQLPGLNVYSNGEPGKPFEVYSRLFSGFSLSKVDFYVVDNMPVYGGIEFLSLSDIASISYLDGLTAASVYGEKAANGAIVIRTKEAARTLRVTYSGSAAISNVAKQIDVYSANEFRQLMTVYAPSRVNALGTSSTNWQDAIYRTAFSHQHSIAVSDTRYGIPFRISSSYANQNGVVKTTDYRKFTGALKVSPSFFNDDLRIIAGIWFADDKSSPLDLVPNTYTGNPIESAIFFNPKQPVYEANNFGGYFYNKYDNGTPSYPYNPLALLEQTTKKSSNRFINENIKAEYRFPFLHELSVALNFTAGNSKRDRSKEEDKNTAWNYSQGALSSSTNIHQTYKSWDLSTSYIKEFNWASSKIGVTVGYLKNSDDQSTSSDEFLGGERRQYYTTNDNTKDNAFFGRIRYSILNRYEVGLNYRDGSCSFYGKDVDLNSYSISGNWNVKNEYFLVNSSIVSSLNIFASLGKNRGGFDFDYSGLISYNSNPSCINNFRIGAELGLYNGKVSITTAYSRNRVSDVLSSMYVPSGTNFSNTILGNVGCLKSSNLDITARVLLVNNSHFSWNVGFVMSYATNEVEKFSYSIEKILIGNKVSMVGNSIGSFYLNKQVYDVNDKPLEGVYEDFNKNGFDDDQYVGKQSTPLSLMTISSQLSYKGWNFSFLGRASIGNYVYNGIAAKSYYGRLSSRQMNNISKLVERTNFVNNQSYSDIYVENGSFFRMEYLSLGYTFKGKMQPHLSATVQNAFLISRYSGVDPEVSSGVDYASYPRSRIISVALELAL